MMSMSAKSCHNTGLLYVAAGPATAARAGALSAAPTGTSPTAATSANHTVHNRRDIGIPFGRAQTRVHLWLACPLQVHRTTVVPFAVPAPLTSRQSPEPTFV